MSFFEYFDAGYVLVIGLLAVAAVTPTLKDDHVMSRVKNLMGKVLKVRDLFKKK